jgi:hypothetical protein
MSGTGGTSGTGGGSSGTAGMAARDIVFPFDSDEMAWEVQYVSVGKDDAMMDVPTISKDDITTKWVTGKGDGDDGGALQGDIPYTSPKQYVGLGIHLAFEDLTDKLITARVKLDSGVVSDADIASKTPGAKIYVKGSGDLYVYCAGVYQSITTHGTWYTLKLNLADPSSWSYVDKGTDEEPKVFDPSSIGELGVQFDSPGDLTTVVSPGIVLVDNVTY